MVSTLLTLCHFHCASVKNLWLCGSTVCLRFNTTNKITAASRAAVPVRYQPESAPGWIYTADPVDGRMSVTQKTTHGRHTLMHVHAPNVLLRRYEPSPETRGDWLVCLPDILREEKRGVWTTSAHKSEREGALMRTVTVTRRTVMPLCRGTHDDALDVGQCKRQKRWQRSGGCGGVCT